MLWLYNKDSTICDFFQVFVDSNIVYNENNNSIYSLGSIEISDKIPVEISNVNNNTKIKNLDKIKYDYYSFDIRIMDQIISYTFTDNSDQQIVFSSKMNFIEPSNNKLNLPIFNFTYKKVNKNRMPNLINSNYNFSSTLEFKIFKISNQVQFIIETNPTTKIIKKYFITTDLDYIKNYI
jgi:hypothetical protein